MKKVYGFNQDQSLPTKGIYMPWFYLHGEADCRNDYDLCGGNTETLVRLLIISPFPVGLYLQDGSVFNGIVLPWVDSIAYRVSGLVCILSDVESIKHALYEYSDYINKFPKGLQMYDDDIDFIEKNYPETWQILRAYSRCQYNKNE